MRGINKYICIILTFTFSSLIYASELIPVPGASSDPSSYDPTSAESGGAIIAAPVPVSQTSSDVTTQILSSSAASTTTLVRWTAGQSSQQKIVTDGNVYYRDAFVGVNFTALATADGDQWTVQRVYPESDGSSTMIAEEGSAVKYYAEFGGAQSCFYAPGWLYYICGSTQIDLKYRFQSQCEPAGQWTFEILKNGSTINSIPFDMKLEIADDELPSALNQNTNPRSPYDSICKNTVTNTTVSCDSNNITDPNLAWYSIGAKGCAMTSSAMIANYHGAAIAADQGLIDLNDDLVNGNGFTSSGKVIWSKIDSVGDSKGASWDFIGFGNRGDDQGLRDAICTYGPQLMGVNTNSTSDWASHFLVVYGKETASLSSEWKILDPAGGVKTTSTKYNNRNLGFRMFKGTEQDYPFEMYGILIRLYSPAELLLESLDRKLTGYDPITGSYYSDIPLSSYQVEAYEDQETQEPDDHPLKMLYVGGLIDPSDFTLNVIGTGYGTYNLEIVSIGESGSELSATLLKDVQTAPGEKHAYAIKYDKNSPSSAIVEAGYSGGGQSQEVNGFIRYSSPTQARTQLPAGSTEYRLNLEYSERIDPATFSAEWNGADISNQFIPAAGTSEVVVLPLNQGTNKLIIKARGTKDSGQMANDTDRLTFIVQ